MLKEKENLYHKIVFVYTLTYAIYSLFGRFTWLHALVEHTVNGFLYSFFALFGFPFLYWTFSSIRTIKRCDIIPFIFSLF